MRSLRIVLAALVASLFMSSSAYSVVLSTTFAGGNGQSGNMFDVNVLGGALNVSQLDLNLNPGSQLVELYTRVGTWVGFDGSSAGWTLVGSQLLTSNGNGVPTPFSVAFTLPGASTTGIYVTSTNGGVSYTNGTAVGNVFASNADLEILEGAGIEYPFSGTYTPRIWNGSITYTLAGAQSVPEVDATTAALPLSLLLMLFAVMADRRRRVVHA